MTDNGKAARRQAHSLAVQAAELLGEVTTGSTWPTVETAMGYLDDDSVVHALGLYLRAMTLAPENPEYPWNAGSAAWRIGHAAVGVGLMARAVVLVERGQMTEDWDASGMWLAVAQAAWSAEIDGLAATAVVLAVRSADGQLDETIERVAEDLSGAVTELMQAVFNEGRILQSQIGGYSARAAHTLQGPAVVSPQESSGDVTRIVEPQRQWWVVRKEGAARSSGRFASREEALGRAQQIVANKGGGKILLRQQNKVEVRTVKSRRF